MGKSIQTMQIIHIFQIRGKESKVVVFLDFQKQFFIWLEPDLFQCILDFIRCRRKIQHSIGFPWASACGIDGEYHLIQRSSRLSADREPLDNWQDLRRGHPSHTGNQFP